MIKTWIPTNELRWREIGINNKVLEQRWQQISDVVMDSNMHSSQEQWRPVETVKEDHDQNK